MIDSYFLDGGAFIMDASDTATYWSGGRFFDNYAYRKSVSKSTDAGATWTRYDLAMSNGSCEGLAIDPIDSDIVYAAGYPGFHRTTDGGETWEQITTGMSGYTYDVVVDTDDPYLVYAGGTNGVFKSTNRGDDWTDLGLTGVNTILIDPQNHDCLYAGTESGVFKTTNIGTDWAVMSEGLEDLNVTSLGIYPGQYLFCGTNIGGMYRWDISTGAAETETIGAEAITALPNPMRHWITIAYSLSHETRVELTIFDVQGRTVRNLMSEIQSAGMHRRCWDGTDGSGGLVAAGVYFCKLTTGTANCVLKVIVTR